ncbi:MAG TPA: nucleoside triphosphate pyrophosphohydrolase [Anaerolineales bacterium]|nr:nucleoside triphosphate pyrophosphohydrolase [Anaerolineales bacterium]
MITILGLGPGDPGLLTREAWAVLSNATELYARTARHPTLGGLPPTLTIRSFDDVYDSTEKFEEVYRQIVDRVIELGKRPDGVLYAVPGHPSVGESTVEQIRERAAELNLPVRLVNGLSFVEPTLAAIGVDALPGLFVADALDLAARAHPPFPPDAPALVAQLYSPGLASDVKLTLMNQYADDQRVALAHAVGTPDEKVEWLPLHQIDGSDSIAHLTALYIPALARSGSFESFQNTVARLRAPDGCPWDREQTHQTLREHLLEETYETLAAIDADDLEMLREELGDLLLQVVLQTQIAIDDGEFHMAEVIAGINEKLIRRHPHVFGEVKVNGAGEVLANWEKLKEQERAGDPAKTKNGILSTVPVSLPALAQAFAYQSRVARVGFDWPDISGVIAKVHEEIAEIDAAAESEQAAEAGDLLFAVVNWARWLKVDPESALREANAKFAKRFAHVEAGAKAQGKELRAMTLEEMDALWNEAKIHIGK